MPPCIQNTIRESSPLASSLHCGSAILPAMDSVVYGDELSVAGVHASRVLRGTRSRDGAAVVVKTFAVAESASSSGTAGGQLLSSSAGAALASAELSAQQYLAQCPYIFAASEVAFDASRLSLSSPFADRGSLDALRRRASGDGALAPSAIMWVALCVTRALAHAHARGIVHGNLRPSNIMLATGVWVTAQAPSALTDTSATGSSSAAAQPAAPAAAQPVHRPASAPSKTGAAALTARPGPASPTPVTAPASVVVRALPVLPPSDLYDATTSAEIIDSNVYVGDFLGPASVKAREAAVGGAGFRSGGAATLYSAPELLRDLGDAPSFASDMWALGSVLWTISTGSLLAATGESRAALRRGDWLVDTALPPGSDARKRWDSLSGALRDLIMRCLAVDPRDRPSAASASRHDALALGLVAERSASAQLEETKRALSEAVARAQKAEELADERASHTVSLLKALARAETASPAPDAAPSKLASSGVSAGSSGGSAGSIAVPAVDPKVALASSAMQSPKSSSLAAERKARAAATPAPALPPAPPIPANASPEDLVRLLLVDDSVHEKLIAEVAAALSIYVARSEHRRDVAIGAGAAPALVAALRKHPASVPASSALATLARSLSEGRADVRRAALVSAGAVNALVSSLNMHEFCRSQVSAAAAETHHASALSIVAALRTLGYNSDGVKLA